MGNLVVGCRTRRGVRPYVVGGVGLIRTNVDDIGSVFDVNTKNDFGLDVGGGVMGFFSKNVGLRGDIRYFRGFRGTQRQQQPDGPDAQRLQVLARVHSAASFRFWHDYTGLKCSLQITEPLTDTSECAGKLSGPPHPSILHQQSPRRPPSGLVEAAGICSCAPTPAA